MKQIYLLIVLLIKIRVSSSPCMEQTSCEIKEVSNLSHEWFRWCRKDNGDSIEIPFIRSKNIYSNVTNWSVLRNIPLPTQHKYEYDSELSRIALVASSAAYTRSLECINVTLPQSQFIVTEKFKIECYELYIYKDTCFAYVAISHIDKMVVVAFRGSKTLKQVSAQSLTSLFPKGRFIEDGKVHVYYQNSFYRFQSAGLEEEIKRVHSLYQDYKFLVTGHSLGGALASLASLSMVYYGLVPSTQLYLYTFGMPRAGDKQYARLHDRYIVNSMRVVNRGDFITKVPMKYSWCHHGTKIIADEINSEACFGNYFSRLIQPHINYMGIPIGSYCKKELKKLQKTIESSQNARGYQDLLY